MKYHKPTITGIVLGKLIGLVVLLVMLAVASTYFDQLTNPAAVRIFQFLNQNLGLILLFTFILMLGEIFWVLVFPFNLLSPPVNAIGSLFLVTFILEMLVLMEEIIEVRFFPFSQLNQMIIGLVFVLVLVVGYVQIFGELLSSFTPAVTAKPEITPKTKSDRHTSSRQTSTPDWSDIGQELRATVMDVLVVCRRKIKQ